MQKLDLIKFEAPAFRDAFHDYIADLSLSLHADDEQDRGALKMIDAFESNIDIMQRVDSDYMAMGRDSIAIEDINQIGDYAMTLISELAVIAANRGLKATMTDITRLSMPVACWISRHNGKILKLDVVVNALASYANELTEPKDLEQLSDYIEDLMTAIEDDVKKDIETTNPVRPWRILNLNWGIVATRSYNTELIDKVYAQLMRNIPADIHGFITEAMQQMDIVGYPDNVRQIVAKYYGSLGYDQSLH